VAWLSLLTHPTTYEPLRTQVPVWEIVIYLEHHEYRDVIEVLENARASQHDVPLPWLRLIAAHTLEEKKSDRFADELSRACVTELAARGELQQVLDLAQRFGIEALGDAGGAGFAFKYVQGVIKYQQARTSHNSEEPTLDAEIGAMYGGAAAALKAAAAEPDAPKYPVPAASCLRLIAWCSFFRGNFLDATAEFEEASSALSGNDAAEALWMAVVSLDKVVEAGRSIEAREQLNGLIDRFLALYPDHPNAARLMVKRSFRIEEASPETVNDLLAVPPSSDVYDLAQGRAADMLYQLFRRSREDDRLGYASQFLSVAVPLISEPPRRRESSHADLAPFVVRCRQVLEVALAEGVERLVAARAAIDSLEAVNLIDPASVSPHRDEIDCRKVQERLYAGDADAAATLTEELWSRDATSIWSRLAVRSMFKQAFRVWRSAEAEATPQERQAAVERVARYGGRVLYEFGDEPDALERSGAMGYYTAVADATFALWQSSGDPERAKAALFLYDKLLARRPNSAAFLRAAALLAEKVDRQPRALDHWRRLVAGSEVGSEGWYEAKFHQIQLLAKLDPPRAREVMNQHKQLNPNFGPSPWGPKIKGLDEQIPLNPDPKPATQPESESDTAPNANLQSRIQNPKSKIAWGSTA
jgi:tetratricopeptide (TPR) repeat protein